MSRVPKWKIEKTKVKVVFRLQFHATNIPSTGWDKLFLSFISAHTGKVTAKTNKANVRNGSCKWPDPIYEATQLLQDSRTKTYDDKLYKLVVAMGTSRSSILGEVDVNLAEFAEALKPASITLPLRGSDSGTLLNITAQLLNTKTGFREFEQQRETGARSSQQLLNQRSHDPAEVAAASSDIGTDKVNARIKLKETSLGFPFVEDSAGSTEDYENSSHTSDGIFTEKNDPYGAHEISSFRSSGDLPLCPTSQSPTPEKGAHWGKHLAPQGSNVWTHGWSPEYSADKDLATAHDENNQLRTRLEVAESAFSQLKTEATSLEHVTDKLGTETQGLAQQLAVELMSRNQLTTEVSLLRTECSKLKKELKEMRSSKVLQKKSDAEDNTMSKYGNDIIATDPVHHLQTEWLQGLLLLESKLQQTRNNALHGLQASDLDFLLADLGALQRVIENLKQGVQPGQINENHYAENLVPLPNTSHLSNLAHHDTLKKSSGGNTGTMEEKMCELLQKLENSKTEKESLLEKMSHMERYYESFIHKLEENQKQTAIELENLKKEHNSCFYTVSVLQAQKQKMHEEMNDQLMRFVEDRTALEAQNKELERRALATETALKRVRFNYSAAVERLQKDLELLSFQVLSMYESNETLAKQSFLEDCDSLPEEHSAVADLCGNKEPEQYILAEKEPQAFLENNCTLDKMDGQKNLRTLKIEELRVRSEFHVHGNTDSRGNHSNMVRPKRTSCTMESELLEMFIANMECQVFSDVLRESHFAALDIIKCMQGRLHMLEKKLHDSNDAKQSLGLKLSSALDQAKSVKESEARYILKCDDLTVRNQILEAKLHDITVENALFMEKFTESERLVQEHSACESKYKVCAEERERFENLLIKESLLTDQLQGELRSLREGFEAMKEELDKQSSINNDIRKFSTYLQDQLGGLCSKIMSFNKEINISGLDDASFQHELESKNYAAVMKSLEFFHQQTCNKVLHVQQEKETMVEMCDALQRRSEKAESELHDMKQKYVCDLDATNQKLNFSEELVEKLQQELQDMAHKLRISSDSQEKYSVTNSGLSSKLSLMEVELQHATSKNEALVEKLKEFGVTVEELERTKISLAQYKEDTQTLTQSLQFKDEMLVQMESEIKLLHDDLRCTGENLLREKSLKEELESALASLTSQLGEKDLVLLSFNEQKTESIHLKDQLLDMEKANSIMQGALLQSEQIQRDLSCKNQSLHSQLSNLGNQLGIVLEVMLSTEIEAIYMRSQVREAVVQLNMLRNDFEKLQLKSKDADELLRVHMSTQAELADRNSMLEAAIHSLEINLCSVSQEKKGLEELMKGHEEALTEANNNKSCDIAGDNSEKIVEDRDEISHLRVLLADLEEQVDNVKFTKDETEILNIILRSKLEEQHAVMSSLLQNQRLELTNVIEHNKDLTQKLAEQSLKAEEFKNLSIHLRELKEKAEIGRKEKEGSLHAMQDSLRIAFIKEQYESKVQELKGQVFVNKKYAEEMLLKLQNALDDVETGKKNEIALAKRIEELSIKISEMEVEMHDLSTDKRELSNAYDSMMTELECTKLNLDCCNEEKLKIEVSLVECCEERNRIRVELDLVKKLLENMALTDKNTSHDRSGSYTPVTTSIGHILGDGEAETASKTTPSTIEMDSALQEYEIQSRSLTSNLSRADDIGTFGEDEASKSLELTSQVLVTLDKTKPNQPTRH
ncbi:girdin-like isoform X2 [Panicum virgatum]|uniref:girdin-like isoform X2 n=1 Tax=Panicum virgatum TaxID=38727 RepID=UPI0019D625FF|nr:girdin-like isoform X2 [Panicum virgatum]